MKRNQFYHLNHFNMHQIMYLCQELAGITDGGHIPDQVFTLLELVKRGVEKKEIFMLLLEATKHKEQVYDEENEIFEGELYNMWQESKEFV